MRVDSRILVATPSNSSADLIVERLADSGRFQSGDMARINAFNRSPESVPERIHPYCYTNDEMEVLRKVVQHRIVVSTCSTAGGLFKLGLTKGHFRCLLKYIYLLFRNDFLCFRVFSSSYIMLLEQKLKC